MIEGWRNFLAAMEAEGLLHATRKEMEDRLIIRPLILRGIY